MPIYSVVTGGTYSYILFIIYSFTENLTHRHILYNNNIKLYMHAPFTLILALLSTLLAHAHQCQHDVISHSTQKHYINDLTDGRLLQGTQSGRLRIFVDYTQLTVGGPTQINTIKRIMNISASYFYNVINVTRLPRLFFPPNTPLTCNALTIPSVYVTQGTIGDLGIVCGNQKREEVQYIAKATPCAFLQSTKRPTWGMVMFNNVYLKFDQQGFQQILFIGMHELTHVLGFSASMYASYPNGNPLVTTPEGANYINTPKIQQQIKKHFGCGNAKGLLLQDQDGTLIGSHWQKKVVGNEYMISSNKKNSFVSRFTLALLDSTGFYTSVNYDYAEPSVWGKNKNCSFLNNDDCNYQQFCTDRSYACDSDATGIGRCSVDPYTNACMVVKYFTNTICVDENYQIRNLNANLNGLQRGGSNSRCFESDFRQQGLNKNFLNNRCYVSVCSSSGKFLYILVGSYILVCRSQSQVIIAPPGLNGTLTCPKTFEKHCQSKKTCPYHCNKNGACINGQCLCTGVTNLTQSCIDVSILKAPVGQTGGLKNAAIDNTTQLDLFNLDKPTPKRQILGQTVTTFSINRKCIQGSTFDLLFGQCLKCSDVYNCQNCDDNGCLVCDDGSRPVKTGNIC